MMRDEHCGGEGLDMEWVDSVCVVVGDEIILVVCLRGVWIGSIWMMVLVVEMLMIGGVWVMSSFRMYTRIWSESVGLSILWQGNVRGEA